MKKYNWNAKDYEAHSQAQQQWARELIAKLNLAGDEDLLDVGCGDGKVTAEIARLTPNGSVIGVDNSSAMIELALERHPSRDHPNLSFEVMDAVELSYVDQFDVVFSNAALHWVRDHRPVVAGLYRSLKPGGRILLQMGGKGNAERIIAVLGALQATEEWRSYFEDFEFPYGFLGADEYTQLLHDAGFTTHRVELIPKDMAHDGQAEDQQLLASLLQHGSAGTAQQGPESGKPCYGSLVRRRGGRHRIRRARQRTAKSRQKEGNALEECSAYPRSAHARTRSRSICAEI